MDTSSVLWTNWHEQLKELLTGIHGHQKKTLAFFVLGIVLSGSAVMMRHPPKERTCSKSTLVSSRMRRALNSSMMKSVSTPARRVSQCSA